MCTEVDLKKISAPVAVLVTFIIIMLIGQAGIYIVSPYHCEAYAERSGTSAMVSVNTNYSFEYSVVSLGSESMSQVGSYALYFDEEYPVNGDIVAIRDCIDRLKIYFGNDHSGFDIINTEKLVETVLKPDITVGIIFITGTLPEEIYSGDSEDPLFVWLSKGGVMYWLCEKIGYTYSVRGESSVRSVSDSDVLFFGNDDVVRKIGDQVYTRNVSGGSLTDIVGVYYGETTNGIDCNKLTDKYLALDCNDGTYSAVTLVKYFKGGGMICVFGGHLKQEDVPTSVMASVAQVIVSKLSYDTVLYGSVTSTGSRTFEMECSSGNAHIFVYVGKMNAIWAKTLVL